MIVKKCSHWVPFKISNYQDNWTTNLKICTLHNFKDTKKNIFFTNPPPTKKKKFCLQKFFFLLWHYLGFEEKQIQICGYTFFSDLFSKWQEEKQPLWHQQLEKNILLWAFLENIIGITKWECLKYYAKNDTRQTRLEKLSRGGWVG